MLYSAVQFADKTGMCGDRVQDEDAQEVGNSWVNAVCACMVALIITWLYPEYSGLTL
jgi:hypothetical protein